MSGLYWLTDKQMARLEAYFPKSHGKLRVDDRRVLGGIVSVNRDGLRWRDAPSAYGPHKTLYNRWMRWGGTEGLPPHDGGPSCRGCATQDRHDRRDLPEGTPHGVESAGKKGALGG